MDTGLCLIAGRMLWVSLPFFMAAMAFRFYRWFSVPTTAVKLGLFGGTETGLNRWLKLGKESFLFPQILELDPQMWWFVASLHLAGTLLLIGHLRLIVEFTFLSGPLGDRGMERFALWSGGAVALVLLVTVAYFLIRRLRLPGRSISVPGDYFLLALLLALTLTGAQMRFFYDVPVSVYREYVRSIFSFDPHVPAALTGSAAGAFLGIHVALANVLILYFPMSRLMHFVGSFTTNLIRNERLWKKTYRSP